MEIVGKIIQKLPEQSGVSKAGNNWKKQEYILETQEAYPKKVCFHFFGDRADQFPLEEGKVYTISFDINSREFNGRWYTDISGWKAEEVQEGAIAQPESAGYAAAPAPVSDQASESAPAAGADFLQGGSDENNGEDLPF